jgi:hypothetical protein
MTKSQLSRFQIERGGVRIEIINPDPDGLPSYRSAFVFNGEGELTVRDAWAVARFLTRHAIRAEGLMVKRAIRRRLGMGTRP